MAPNLIPPTPTQPLSIGNVVSAGVRLYRSHFKLYLSQALQGFLWLLIPIYGWAKFYEISARVSRLAFAELIGQPESLEMARSKTESRLWSFLAVAFRVGLLLILVYFGLAIVGVILVGILVAILTAVLGQTASTIIGALAGLLMAIFFLVGFMWFFSRWMLAEVPLAVEEGINAGQSVDRSWELTKHSVFRIQGIAAIAFLVSLPLQAVTTYVPYIFLLSAPENSTLYWIIYSIYLIGSLVGGALVMPFWQAIKAVLYYDLRSRREGLGLQLRDREI